MRVHQGVDCLVHAPQASGFIADLLQQLSLAKRAGVIRTNANRFAAANGCLCNWSDDVARSCRMTLDEWGRIKIGLNVRLWA